MKIESITKDGNIFNVVVSPGRIGRIFGKKKEIRRFKSAGRIYLVGPTMYYEDNGGVTGPLSNIAESIDRFRRKF